MKKMINMYIDIKHVQSQKQTQHTRMTITASAALPCNVVAFFRSIAVFLNKSTSFCFSFCEKLEVDKQRSVLFRNDTFYYKHFETFLIICEWGTKKVSRWNSLWKTDWEGTHEGESHSIFLSVVNVFPFSF